MKEFKRTAVLIACVVLLWGQTARAVAIPMLPYVPPNDAQLWDMIFNAFGVTAPAIDDAEKKLEAYWNLYEMALESGYEEFEQGMTEIMERAKTSRKIIIEPTVREKLVRGMKKAISDGMTYTTGGTTISQYADYVPLLNQAGVTRITAAALQSNASANNVPQGQIGDVYLYAYDTYGVKYNVFVLPKGATASIATIDGVRSLVFTGISNATVTAWQYVVNTDTIWENQTLQNPTRYISNNATVTKIGGATTATATVTAKNSAVRSSIFDEIASVITAATELVNGVMDNTKPITVRLPITIPLPATDVSELDEAEDALNVVPSADTADVAETVSELQEVETARYGDTADYTVDLTMYFPFCIPFDLVRIVTALDAEPEAPHITFLLPSDVENGEVVFTEYEFSLDWMSPVMVWVRRGELILGGIGIMLATRNIIRG